ncbi:hypothetical protein Ab1vBOLIVR5_gp20 [Agrobacterium phage OLIVR5]|uniref:Uncharacterized protein n=2 Tax=Caudoviricetes TaxID=2731619 RepID=A0A858MSV1_9CAUD|nr:hypothetical protein KNU99_gp020 [Agrobacterium phage OLIVR5]QIW87668.1 hypothetical protein Ab1vBOLIVR5_gp20 [Agrobacterium phage OLIVR5]QIW87927.1 hypothetical protein Ab1vBOLIVR6_gp20 [Agrobacterium phage OLIVR6]
MKVTRIKTNEDDPVKIYTIGPATAELVFKRFGIENLYDLQLVLDKFEQTLQEISEEVDDIVVSDR